MSEALRTEDRDQRPHRAPRPQVGLQPCEQRIAIVGAAQEPQRRRQHLGQEHGVGGRSIGAGHLDVAVEAPLAGRVAPGVQQRTEHHVDPPSAIVVDSILQQHRVLDGARHVGHRARAHVRRQRIHQQVDGDARRFTGDFGGRLAQARRRLGRAAARQRQPAAQLAAADPLDEVVGTRVGVDDLVGPVEQVACGPGHPGVEHCRCGEAQPADPVAAVR